MKAEQLPLAANEASDGNRLPWSAAATGSFFFPAPARRLSRLGSLGRADAAAPTPHAVSSDGDTAIELLSEVVT